MYSYYLRKTKFVNSILLMPLPGKHFTEEQKLTFKAKLESIGLKVSPTGKSALRVSSLKESVYEELEDLIETKLPRKATKQQTTKELKEEARKIVQETKQKAMNDNFTENKHALDFIHKHFGEDFANNYNKNALVNLLTDKTKTFEGMITGRWQDGLEALGAISFEGGGFRADFEKIKQKYQASLGQ